MAAVTICSDIGAPQNKVWHCFYCFSIYSPWSDGTGCHDLVLGTLKSGFRANSLWSWKFTKCYKELNLDDIATLFSIQCIFSWRGFSEESHIFYRVSCLSKAIEYYTELSKKGSSVIWIWFGYLKKHKFDQTFLYMKYNLKHITSEKKKKVKLFKCFDLKLLPAAIDLEMSFAM